MLDSKRPPREIMRDAPSASTHSPMDVITYTKLYATSKTSALQTPYSCSCRLSRPALSGHAPSLCYLNPMTGAESGGAVDDPRYNPRSGHEPDLMWISCLLLAIIVRAMNY